MVRYRGLHADFRAVVNGDAAAAPVRARIGVLGEISPGGRVEFWWRGHVRVITGPA